MKSSSSSSMWHAVGSSSSGAFQNQVPNPEISEEELERQYAAYKAQFEEWIEKNRNHPDRDAYNRYVSQFKEWEAQVDANRRAIREWKAARGEKRERVETQTDQTSTTSKHPTNGATAKSETSSPPLSSTSGKKKKKLKKKKVGGDPTGNEDNPMMAMMKMMAANMAAGGAAAAAPPAAPPSLPVDPFSMMMAMTMMMPMMMNAAPCPPAAPAQSSPTKAASSLPDVSKPPPGFPPPEDDPPSRRHEQAERDRAFRGDRSFRHQERHYASSQGRSSPPGGGRVDVGSRRPRDDQDGSGDRGDYWYQRWLANRQHQQPTATATAAADPWLHPPQPPQAYRTHPQAPVPTPATGPVPLWPPGGSAPPVRLDRDPYAATAGPPYVSRSHFGARDFSMRKQQHQRRWD